MCVSEECNQIAFYMLWVISDLQHERKNPVNSTGSLGLCARSIRGLFVDWMHIAGFYLPGVRKSSKVLPSRTSWGGQGRETSVH
jgi:hypothetical protein